MSTMGQYLEEWSVQGVKVTMTILERDYRRGQVLGWVQTVPADDAVFVVQSFVDAGFQGRGIGPRLETAHRRGGKGAGGRRARRG
jgi:GNAT superfamily N-acetyltransferase